MKPIIPETGPLLARIDELLACKKRVFLAIEGNSGAGKTTFAKILARTYQANLFQMDDFFLTPELRSPERFKEPGGNVDYLRFKTEIITGLQKGGPFQYQAFDCRKGALQAPVMVEPRPLNIIEGVYSMHPELAEFYDITVFLAVDPSWQRQRILKRSGPALYRRFVEEWIPLEDRYFKKLDIRAKCDFSYDNLEL